MASRSGRLATLCAGALLVGCGSGYVKLDAKKVRDVQVRLREGGNSYCPNGPLWPEVVAVIAYDGGKILETSTPNHAGKVRPSDLEWTTEVGRIHESGLWLLPLDLLPWHDRRFSVRAAIPTRPEMAGQLEVTPRFDCGGVADYAGLDGYGASAGRDGAPGGPGPRVEVALAYVDTTLHGRLVLVRVIDRDLGRRGYHLVDPRAARRLVIKASGGDGAHGAPGGPGGPGSSGSRGADGASGRMCENGQDGYPGSPGQPGSDGQPGSGGGAGGHGGVVTMSYPAAFPELASAVDITVEGGVGGTGGTGGNGGEGGRGGPGGNGGSPGPTSDPNQVCSTARGQDGREGPRGSDGNLGASGAAGPAGERGTIAVGTASVETLFAFELKRGWKIVSDR